MYEVEVRDVIGSTCLLPLKQRTNQLICIFRAGRRNWEAISSVEVGGCIQSGVGGKVHCEHFIVECPCIRHGEEAQGVTWRQGLVDDGRGDPLP